MVIVVELIWGTQFVEVVIEFIFGIQSLVSLLVFLVFGF